MSEPRRFWVHEPLEHRPPGGKNYRDVEVVEASAYDALRDELAEAESLLRERMQYAATSVALSWPKRVRVFLARKDRDA